MGKNHRFKLSDMVPNAWFYKLKLDMNTTTNLPNNNNNNNNSSLPSTNKTRQHHPGAGAPLPRKSYHFPRDLSPSLPHPPRKSSKQTRSLMTKSRNKPAAASSVPRKPVYRTEDDSVSPDSIFRLDRVLTPESLGSCGSRPVDPVFDDPDIVIYVDENSFVSKPERAMGNRSFGLLPNLELPRIVTRPAEPKHSNNTDHVEAEQLEAKKPTTKGGENRNRKSGSRRCSVSSSPRPRLRIRSPRLAGRRTAQTRRPGPGTGGSGTTSARKKLSGSFAVVKSSLDPKRDFRESMVEMIVEHNIKASKDLEELLACYLSLNTDEYHELIIEVFTQIWFDLTDIDSFDIGLRSRESFR